jgi:hypothetical protein
VSTSEQQERLPLMTADEIRRLPQDVGLLTYRNRRGVLLDLTAWDERRDAATIQAAKRGTEAEQHDVFAQRYVRRTTTVDAAESAPAEEES